MKYEICDCCGCQISKETASLEQKKRGVTIYHREFNLKTELLLHKMTLSCCPKCAEEVYRCLRGVITTLKKEFRLAVEEK